MAENETEERNPFKQVMIRLDLLDETLDHYRLPKEDILAAFHAQESGSQDPFYAQVEAQLAALRKAADKDNKDEKGEKGDKNAKKAAAEAPAASKEFELTMEAIMGSFYHQLDGQRTALEGVDSQLKALAKAMDALKEQVSGQEAEVKKIASSAQGALGEKRMQELKYYEKLCSDIWHRTFDNSVEVEKIYNDTQEAVVSDEAWKRFPQDAQRSIYLYANYGNYFAGYYEAIKKIFEDKKGGKE